MTTARAVPLIDPVRDALRWFVATRTPTIGTERDLTADEMREHAATLTRLAPVARVLENPEATEIPTSVLAPFHAELLDHRHELRDTIGVMIGRRDHPDADEDDQDADDRSVRRLTAEALALRNVTDALGMEPTTCP